MSKLNKRKLPDDEFKKLKLLGIKYQKLISIVETFSLELVNKIFQIELNAIEENKIDSILLMMYNFLTPEMKKSSEKLLCTYCFK